MKNTSPWNAPELTKDFKAGGAGFAQDEFLMGEKCTDRLNAGPAGFKTDDYVLVFPLGQNGLRVVLK